MLALRPPLPARPPAHGQRGAASLIVVMLLFFLMALVAAYTSRNLIFEQRTSTNQYRASQAFEAAEAGLNWALAQLNGGRIDANCEDTNDPNQTTFRGRYIESIDLDGNITIKTRTPGPGVEPALLPACVFDPDSTGWLCSCPSDAAPSLPTPASPLSKPMFRVRLEYVTTTPRRDVIRIVSAGCTRVDPACLSANPSAPGGDAIAVLSAVVTLRSGLSTAPAAPITARRNVTLAAGAGAPVLTQASNVDPSGSGLTVLAGGSVIGVVGTDFQPLTLPGTPPELSVVGNDSRIAGYGTGARMFGALFGMSPDLHRDQPAAVQLDCTGGCDSTDVNGVLTRYPGRVVWITGDLEVNGDIGAAPTAGTLAAAELAAHRPALLIVTGNASLTSGTVWGVIYSQAADWNLGAGSAVVQGGLIAEGNLTGSGQQQLVYNAELLRELRTRTGSFVRVPGGWRDF